MKTKFFLVGFIVLGVWALILTFTEQGISRAFAALMFLFNAFFGYQFYKHESKR